MQLKLYSTEETAGVLRMSVRTLQRLVAEGKIRPTKITPGRNRYTEEEIARYLRSVMARKE